MLAPSRTIFSVAVPIAVGTREPHRLRFDRLTRTLIDAEGGRLQRYAVKAQMHPSEDVLQSLQTLFSSMIPVVEAEAVVEAPLLRLDLSADALFRAGSTQLQPGRDLLMERIAQALSDAEQRGLYPQVELFHGMKQSSDATPETRSLAVRRLGALVRGFVERGRPAADLSIGVLADAGPSVRLLFRFYKEPPEPIDLGEVRE